MDNPLLDTTIKPLCFPELGREYTPSQAKNIGVENFKKYEYILYLMAQVSRLVYCDTGVINEIIKSSIGLSNDIVNNEITKFDKEYSELSRKSMPTPPGIDGRPMMSYAMKNQDLNLTDTSQCYGAYLSTPKDVTCLMLDTTVLKPNSYSLLTPNDVIVSFKGSSTIQNFIDDAKSVKPTDFSQAIKHIVDKPGLGNVADGFIGPLLEAFSFLIESLKQRLAGKQNSRVLITGHSLGGAYATLFAWILALIKDRYPEIQSIHIVTFGAPTLFSDTARNQFNSLLDSGVLTFDRVVSQQIANIKMVGKAAAGGDFIPSIPPGFSHPGYQPLISEFYPEKNGRPYGIQNIRSLFGVTNAKTSRNLATWPFEGAPTNKPPSPENQAPLSGNQQITPGNQQQGGLFGFGEEKTKYESITKQRFPTLVSIAGSKWAIGFPHGEYLGMFFMGALRLAGRKNPGFGTYTAMFSLTPLGVVIQYKQYQQGGKRKKIYNRKTRTKRLAKKRHTRKH